MKVSLMFLVIFGIGSARAAWQCDLGKELNQLKTEQRQSKSSRTFSQNYNGLWAKNMKTFKAFTSAHPKAEPNAYQKSSAGKSAIDQLQGLKTAFQYDTADSYLMGEPPGELPANPKRVDYTHISKIGKKTFYFDGERVVAVRTEINDDELVLKIFESDCSLRELVNLNDGSIAGLPYRYKINREYCSMGKNSKPATLGVEQQDQMAVYLPDDADELKSLAKQIQRDCKQWPVSNKGPGAVAPKSAT